MTRSKWQVTLALHNSEAAHSLMDTGWEPFGVVDRDDGLTLVLRRNIDLPPEIKTATCGNCQRPVVWLQTSKGKMCMVEPATVLPTDTHYDPARHDSHFDTCPPAPKDKPWLKNERKQTR